MGQQALLLILFTAAYTKSELWNKVCPTPLSEVGIDRYFGGMVAHTLHSLTLEDIRHYFKKDATADNEIPTVNYDLTPCTSEWLRSEVQNNGNEAHWSGSLQDEYERLGNKTLQYC